MKHDALLVGGSLLFGVAVSALAGILLCRWAINKVLP